MKYYVKTAKNLKVGDICGHDKDHIYLKVFEISKNHRVTVSLENQISGHKYYNEGYSPDYKFYVKSTAVLGDEMALDFL